MVLSMQTHTHSHIKIKYNGLTVCLSSATQLHHAATCKRQARETDSNTRTAHSDKPVCLRLPRQRGEQRGPRAVNAHWRARPISDEHCAAPRAKRPSVKAFGAAKKEAEANVGFVFVWQRAKERGERNANKAEGVTGNVSHS